MLRKIEAVVATTILALANQAYAEATLAKKVYPKVAVVLPLSGKGNEFGKALKEDLEAIVRDLGQAKHVDLVFKDSAGDLKNIFEMAQALPQESIHTVLAGLGNFDAQSLIKGAAGSHINIVVPHFDENDLGLSGAQAVSFVLPKREMGKILGAWARGRFERVLLLVASDDAPNLDFGIGFEGEIQTKKKRKEPGFLKREYSRNDRQDEDLGKLIKSYNPQLIVFPTDDSQEALWLLKTLATANYAQKVVGSWGWLSKDSLQAAEGPWIGKQILAPTYGEWTGAALDYPDLLIYREAFRWINGCYGLGSAAKTNDCLRSKSLHEVHRVTSGGSEILVHRKAVKLLELNQGGPRLVETIKVP